jgi:hypothetical protein
VIQFSRPRLWAASIVVAAALGAGLWHFYFRPAPAARLLAMMPSGDGPTLFVDIALLRQAGILDQLAGQAGAEEPDYRTFVQATGFDYRRDLDSALLRWRPNDTLIVASGRFDLDRLKAYAQAFGGRCASDICSVQGSTPERQISWMRLGRNLLALAVSRDPMAAALFGPAGSPPPWQPPASAMWLHLPGSHLRPGDGLPPGLSSFLSALDGADRAMLSLVRSGDAASLVLEAPAPALDQAERIKARLTETTAMFRKLLARENRQPDPADLSGVLSGGAFRTEGALVRGSWPLPAAFLARLGR